jgi:hypothetical protein
VLATPPVESDTLTTPDLSGEKLEIKSPDFFDNNVFTEESVTEIVVIGVLEFVPGKERGKFIDECYRILVPEGKMTITVPYWHSWRAYYDARMEWPPFCEQSFLCYNKAWREGNTKGLDLECDFDFTYGYAWEAETLARNDESRAFWTKHYTNSVDALQLTLTKRAKS